MTDFSQTIDRSNPLKLYLQLSEILKKRIESNEWKVGNQIPTEDELCKIYNVSRATVRSAISELVKDGYLLKLQGKGTFVVKKVVADKLLMVTNFDETMLEMSENMKTSVLAQTTVMPLDDLAEKLAITPDKHLIYLKRARFVKDILILIQESYIPHFLCPDLLKENIEKLSLFEFFEKKTSFHITHVKSSFEITLLNAEEAKLFEYPIKTPALMLTQHFYSGNNNIMFSRAVKRPGKGGFFLEFDKKTS